MERDLPKLVIRRKYALVSKYPDGSEAEIKVYDTFEEAEKRIVEFEAYNVGVRDSCGLLESHFENTRAKK